MTLRAIAERGGILIGSGAVNPDYLSDPRFAEMLAVQFNSLSPENELKFDQIEPEEGAFEFGALDTLVAFAQQHDMAVKGHGLISGAFNPEWLTRSVDTPEIVRAATSNHFAAVMGRYAGQVDRWDVATEVLSTFGGSGLDENFWYQCLGADYLVEVFAMAHDADPAATLFLNESLVEYYPAKARELYDLVADLVARGVPIHGVGLESHATSVGPAAGAIAEIIDSYRTLGLEVAITELDVHVLDDGPVSQEEIYGQMVAEALAAGVTDISFWGFTDAHLYTWLDGAKPLMFDEDYDPKPAYFATREALLGFVVGNPPHPPGDAD